MKLLIHLRWIMQTQQTTFLDQEALISGYPATQQGQLDYLNAIEKEYSRCRWRRACLLGTGLGVNQMHTLWGQGSHWDNATLFDHDNKSK